MSSGESFARTDAGVTIEMATGASGAAYNPIGEVAGASLPSVLQALVDVSKLDSEGWALQIPSGLKRVPDLDLDVHWVPSNLHATQHKTLYDAVAGDGGSALFFKFTLPLSSDGGSAAYMITKAHVSEFSLPKVDAKNPKELMANIKLGPTGKTTTFNW
jgi:hypothetical protein